MWFISMKKSSHQPKNPTIPTASQWGLEARVHRSGAFSERIPWLHRWHQVSFTKPCSESSSSSKTNGSHSPCHLLIRGFSREQESMWGAMQAQWCVWVLSGSCTSTFPHPTSAVTLFVDSITSCILANPGHGKHLTPLCNRTQGIKILEEIYEA